MNVREAYVALQKLRPERSFLLRLEVWHHHLRGVPRVNIEWTFWDYEHQQEVKSEHLETLVGGVRVWLSTLPKQPVDLHREALDRLSAQVEGGMPDAVP
jgi:hypothetical protein